MKKAKQNTNVIIIALLVLVILAFGYWRMQVQPGPGEAVSENELEELLQDSLEEKESDALSTEEKQEEETEPVEEKETTDDEETKKEVEEEKPTVVEESDKKVRLVVKEGDLVSFPNLRVDDPDGDEITFTFSEPLEQDGEWQTKVGDAGTYEATITASDGEVSVVQQVVIVVQAQNKAPVITIENRFEVKEGETVTLNPEVEDPEGDAVEITYSGWMTTNSKVTTYSDDGEYTVTITASDGKTSTSKVVDVIVENINRPPVFKNII